jgi:hypothetical protein
MKQAQSKQYRGSGIDGIIKIVKSCKGFNSIIGDKELFWGMRGGYMNVYYKGASIAKIFLEKTGDKIQFELAQKYIDPKYSKSSNTTREMEEWMKDYQKFKRNAEKFAKNEKIAQQEIILANNNDKTSAWYCFDMEYAFARKGKNETNFGRFDILAISKNIQKDGRHKLLLIELKYDYTAYGDNLGKEKRDIILSNKSIDIFAPDFKAGSGIVGHVCDHIRYIRKKDETINARLKTEIIDILSKQNKLLNGSIPQILDIDSIDDKPIIAIITVGCNNIASCQKSMESHLYNGATLNVKKLLSNFKDKGDIVSITKEKFTITGVGLKQPLEILTLFLNNKIGNLNITKFLNGLLP